MFTNKVHYLINDIMELTTDRWPGPLKIDGNISESWKFFKQLFEIYMVTTEKSKKLEKVKMLRCLGSQAIRIFNTFDFANEAEKGNLANVMEKFEKYCMPKKNLFYERHRFNTRIQNKEENFDTFLTDIRNIVINCEYGTL